MDPTTVPREAFEAMVADAIDALPEWTAPIVGEIAVLVEDLPRAGEAPPNGLLLGLFRGVPRTAYGGHPAGMLPDTITLYRIPILLVCERRRTCRTGCSRCSDTRSGTPWAWARNGCANSAGTELITARSSQDTLRQVCGPSGDHLALPMIPLLLLVRIGR